MYRAKKWRSLRHHAGAFAGKIRLSSGQVLEFILAVPGRRYAEFTEVLEASHAKGSQATQEVIDETRWRELRPVHEVCEAHLAKIIKVDLKNELFTCSVDEAAQAKAELMDGKLLLATNVADLSPQEIVQRYKALADIERGFRILKSEIDIAPVYLRLPERIRAHAMLCFMALIVYRVMRQRLKLAKSERSPERAPAQLRRIQSHGISLNRAAPISGISPVNDQQVAVLAALNVKKPTQDPQMSLL